MLPLFRAVMKFVPTDYPKFFRVVSYSVNMGVVEILADDFLERSNFSRNFEQLVYRASSPPELIFSLTDTIFSSIGITYMVCRN